MLGLPVPVSPEPADGEELAGELVVGDGELDGGGDEGDGDEVGGDEVGGDEVGGRDGDEVGEPTVGPVLTVGEGPGVDVLQVEDLDALADVSLRFLVQAGLDEGLPLLLLPFEKRFCTPLASDEGAVPVLW